MPILTKRFVESLKGKEKPYFRSDGVGSQFYVRVMPSSRKSYYAQYKTENGVKKRVLLGQHGVITPEQARNMAAAKRVDAKAGGDPQLEKINKKLEPLVKDVAQRFMEAHVTLHCKPTTQQNYQYYLKEHILPFFSNTKVSEANRATVAAIHHSLRDKPESANRCITVMSKMFNLAEMWGLRIEGTNPCRHVKKFPTKARERYLTKEEEQRLGAVLNEMKACPVENLAAVYCIQLLLLTGCRLSEIRTLKWKYIDYEKKLLRLPDSKTGAKIVRVGVVGIKLLEEIKHHPSRPENNPYVIWGRKPDTCLNNMKSPWRRFRKLAGLDDVNIHDLRHNFATTAVNLGMNLERIGKLLGHTQTNTTARYAHILPGTMEEDAEILTDRINTRLAMNIAVEAEKKPMPESDDRIITGSTIKAHTYLTSEQAAKYLNVKQSLMVDWRYKKTGPSYDKVGQRIRYELKELDAFVQTITATAKDNVESFSG